MGTTGMPTPSRQGEIPGLVQVQKDLLEKLETTVENIIQRLSPVMSPLPPGAKDDKEAPAAKTECGIALRQDNGRLSGAIDALNRVLDALEV